jgi:hypothetical protein
MSSRIAAATLSGAACALVLHALPAEAQDYNMLWGPQPTYPPAMIYPRADPAPVSRRPQPAERRSNFRPFRKKPDPSFVASEPARKQSKDDDEDGARSKPRVSHAGSGPYRTLCVRGCDGYYWPISYATSKAHFKDDEKLCKASCPNQKVALYTHRTEREGSDDAVSLKGKAISELKNAFVYRQEYKPECTCKMPQPLVASTPALKRHAKASAGSSVVGSEHKRGDGLSAVARKSDTGSDTTGSIVQKDEPDKNAGQSNGSAEAEKSDPTRRVRIVGPTFFVDR